MDFIPRAGVVINAPEFMNGLSGRDNLRFLAEIRGEIGEGEIDEIMKTMGLFEARKKRVGQYSMGSHMSMSDYVTACCLGKRIVVIDEQKELLRQLKGIGSNINRLTVLANMGKVQVIALEKAAGELSEVSAALRSVMEGR